MTRIVTTHVGSLPYPHHLTKLMYARQEGANSSGELEPVGTRVAETKLEALAQGAAQVRV